MFVLGYVAPHNVLLRKHEAKMDAQTKTI